MSTLAEFMILSGGDNHPPMLEKHLYYSWKSIMELYMQNREHGRMILESIEHGPLIWPTIEENGVTRTKKYQELSTTEKIQADYDLKATNSILQGDDVIVISSEKVEGSGDCNSSKFQDTANNGQKKEIKAMVFLPNGDRRKQEVKRENKVVKKKLIVLLRGKIYFVKFIINPEEDDVELGVIFDRSFLCMTKEITDFGVGTIKIYPDIDPFLKEIEEEEEKRNDDWDHLLDFNIDDIPLLGEEGLPPLVCKMGKSSRNKKRAMEILNFFYQDIGTSSSAGGHDRVIIFIT
nr:hypothetical protein [Tanacetum cinerariifolium]